MKKYRPIFGWLLIILLMAAIPIVWATTISDDMWYSKGAALGNTPESIWRTDVVEISSAEIILLNSAPKDLVAAPGTGKWLEFVGAVLILDYGTNDYSENVDNMVIQYDGGTDATASIESTDFIDADADTVAVIVPATIAHIASASVVNDALELLNVGSGDGEFAGSGDGTMTVKITYIIHNLDL